MRQVLNNNEPTGNHFDSQRPFQVVLDVYTDGWFVEYAINDESVADKSTLRWKRWHNQPIQEHGELSRVLVYGSSGMLFRLNGGTQGATAFAEAVSIAIFK